MSRYVLRAGAACLGLIASLASCDVYDPGLLSGEANSDAGLQQYESKCGNGRVDDGELCDTALSGDEAGACPTSCATENPCLQRVLTGTKCQTQCLDVVTTKAINDDGCCPVGVGPGEDSDCGGCGDRIIGPKESCEPAAQCPTRDTCASPTACLVAVFSGDPETCSSRCELRVIDTCQDLDGCCPADCDPTTDRDCSSACGDGVVQTETGETCEPTSETQPCPESCDDGIACTKDVVSGSAKNCNLACTHIEVVEPADGDGCCPPGATAINDSDCMAVCHNGVREPGESCDPCPFGCNDNDSCTTDEAAGSASDCSLICTHTPITQPQSGDACCPSGANATSDADCAAVCGNHIVEGYETCDGNCPENCDDGVACTNDTSTGSAGACTLVCMHSQILQARAGDGCCPSGANANTDSDCSPQCGNGVVEPGEACDGGGRCSNCVQIFDSSLVHRYSFDGTGTTVTDSVGSAHGTILGGGSLSGSGTVSLTGGSSGPYVNLPNGLISSLTNASVELWLTWRGGNIWQRAFDFGNNTNGEGNQGGSATSEWFISPCNATSGGDVDMVLNFTSTANDTASDKIVQSSSGCLSTNTKHQLVGVFDDAGNAARLYIDGALAGSRTSITNALSSIDDKNVWIGRSNYANDELNAIVYEVRIYSKALSTSEVQASYAAGENP